MPGVRDSLKGIQPDAAYLTAQSAMVRPFYKPASLMEAGNLCCPKTKRTSDENIPPNRLTYTQSHMHSGGGST